ncbi:murein transglycosylase domain-containing protein [Aliidiomarina soli]|uniref:DUF3393 domain-containing protein n=1 Tax=Aliidiomarina soli TaxID=1928574 RepID=A0A432WHN7_9GAMM|nr:murein transglycosylase domain-containing protein [Aliidiomarina soli]RUO33336.1 DUF3393 domain-containing protein [Aliidiomarina soli]
MKRSPALFSAVAIGCVLILNSCSLSHQQWRTIAQQSGLQQQAEILLREKLKSISSDGDLANLPEVLQALGKLLESIWGQREDEVPSDKRLVKYSNDYQARAIVDFERGYLRVETVAEENPLDQLRQATVLALLTPDNLTLEDIFSDSEPQLGEVPFLYPQVLDQDDEPIRYQWRAGRYADYLIANHLQTRRSEGRTIRYVQTDLVEEHLHLRSLDYADSVLRYARQYNIAPDLVYAVIEVESAFNPYAVSHANALGLMQIVPSTAGRDVFERIKKLPGEPTRQQLFVADFNIEIGTAYLHLLDDLYLNRILHPQSRTYAKISAYNGGAGNVFRAFSSDREQAVARINSMTPQQVYQQLVSTHPFAETRSYLRKVQQATAGYRD